MSESTWDGTPDSFPSSGRRRIRKGAGDARLPIMAGKENIFTVRQATSLDDLRWAMNRGPSPRMHYWIPGVRDAEYLFAIEYTRYFFVGELNGERISCISIIKYDESLAFLGYYFVSESHRGRGYGIRTWKYAFEVSSLGEHCNVGLEGGLDMESLYNKCGFRRVWLNRRCKVTIGDTAGALSNITLPVLGVKTQPGSVVDINQLAEYDEGIHGATRKILLEAWIHISDVSFVAFNEEMEIVGYIILRKTMSFENEGYRIAPLCAESLSIAQILLAKCIEVILSDYSDKKLTFDIPFQDNPEGMAFLETIPNLVSDYDTVRMYTKGVCSIPRNKVFSFASMEIG